MPIVREFLLNGREKKYESYTVTSQEAGERLDVLLSQKIAGFTRSRVKKCIDEGSVVVKGRKVKASYRVKLGDSIQIERCEPEQSRVIPQPIPLTVLYEDSFLLVVDKPAGMVVHPAAGHSQNTLVNALLHHCGDLSGIGGVLRPGIVHRLDKGTSGLLVVAKCDEAHLGLASQFKNRQVKKRYKVLVYGDPKEDEGEIDLPIRRHPIARKKMSAGRVNGKVALTRWRVVSRYGVAALLDVDIITGRTHQIRVHLKALGHPVVGDTVYGTQKNIDSVKNPFLRSQIKALKRQALHAAEIAFTHPITHKEMYFSSPLPEDLSKLCDYLEKTRS